VVRGRAVQIPGSVVAAVTRGAGPALPRARLAPDRAELPRREAGAGRSRGSRGAGGFREDPQTSLLP